MSFLKNLFGHHEAEKAHSQVYGGGSEYGGGFDANDYRDDGQREHQSSFTHEMIAGAAGFAAMKAYEDHVRRSGQQVSHPLMKEMLAGFAAAEVDKLFETKGLDYLDREKAKQMAVHQAHKLAHDKYGPGQVYQGDNSGGYQQQDYNQGTGYQQAGEYMNRSGDGRRNDYNPSYERGDDAGYRQNRSNDYDQSAGGGYDNYINQGQQQQQQWGRGDDQPIPEHQHHHHHHRREEDD